MTPSWGRRGFTLSCVAGGGGRSSVLHAHPGQRVPGKGTAAGAAPAWHGGGAVGLLSSWDVPHPCSAGEPTAGPAGAGLPCMQGGGVPCARPPLHVTGLGSVSRRAPHSAPFSPPLFPLQMRKGPSVSSMPFPPSSPLLSCPPDGARHMVMYRGGSERGGGTLFLYGCGAGQGVTLRLCPTEQTGPARQRHRQRLR